MKLIGSYFLKISGMVALTMPLALDASANLSLTNVQIQSCTSQGDTCIKVKSPTAQVSAVRPIYFMKKIEIEIETPKRQREKSFKKQSQKYKKKFTQGYLDFNNNQLILQSIDKKKTLTEEVYNLTTLQKKVFVTR